jgi:hypothetical protein
MTTNLPYFCHELLRKMEEIISWKRLIRKLSLAGLGAPRNYPPESMESLIRLYLMRQWLGLSYAELVKVVGEDPCAKAFAHWNEDWGLLCAEHVMRSHHDGFHASAQGTSLAATLDAFVNEALRRAHLRLQKTKTGMSMLVSVLHEQETFPAQTEVSPVDKSGALPEKQEDAPARTSAYPSRRKFWKSAALLYGLELLLALLLSAAWVKNVPWLLAFAAGVEKVAPIVGQFDRIARYPEGLRVFLALTVLLLPLKVWLAYMWFGSRKGVYGQFVVSPLSREKDLKPRDFVTDTSPEISRVRDVEQQRSWTAVVFVSVAILAMAAGVMFFFLDFGYSVAEGKPEYLPSLNSAYRSIAYGGIPLWLAWNATRVSFCAIVLSAAVCVIRDWCIFLSSFFTQRSHHE